MMISIALLFTVLVVPSASTWADTGEKNIAALLKIDALSQMFKGKKITPELMKAATEQLRSHFEPKMTFCQAPGVLLMDVSPADCFMALGQRTSNNGHVKMMDWEQTNLAIDPESDGKTILTYVPGDLVGVGTAGEIVPGTNVEAMISNYLYKFSDEGLVKGMAVDFDTSILDGIAQKVHSYNSDLRISTWADPAGSQNVPKRLKAMELNRRQSSWKKVGEINIATVQHLDEIAKELIGNHITSAVLAKLSAKQASFYAPKVTCVTTRQSRAAVHMVDTSLGDCVQAIGKAWSNTRMLDLVFMNRAIDPKTGGNTILTRMRAEFVGVTAAGQSVPGTKTSLFLNFRYKFNRDGLVDYFEQEFDSGILYDVNSIAGQSQGAVQLIESGQRYSATVSIALFGSGIVAAITVMAATSAIFFFGKQRRMPGVLREPFLA